ncbi:hypothetical protein CTAYLR_000759 [Chrysophaeum taylorii]|uniref:Band 7 domain-containing protein n=1 Tax=Chrysophaeum taylorii TaxID=2483200 RepID=A0AAD7XS53_9STRA|nr:hypothetical protein CTAYLR_000759 [Chrysophaeum taylorii]
MLLAVLAVASGDGSVDLRTLAAVGALSLAGICCRESCALITQGKSALVEKLGKFDRQLGPGFHLKLPFVERIAAHLSIRERVLDVPPQRCITADNAPLMADAVIFFKILDVTKAVYAIDDFEIGLQNMILTQLRSEIGQMTLDSTRVAASRRKDIDGTRSRLADSHRVCLFSAREKLNAILLREANEVTHHWGILVVRVEVRDILPSPDIVSAMELQLAAERKKRAAILESEGQRQAQINTAQARRDSIVLAAEGERQRLEAEASGISRALDIIAAALEDAEKTDARRHSAAFMLERARIEAGLALAKSPNAKVVAMPSSSSSGGVGKKPDLDAVAFLASTLGLASSSGSSDNDNSHVTLAPATNTIRPAEQQ